MADNELENSTKSWWSTLTGILTAIGSILTALAVLIAALHTAGLLKSKSPNASKTATVEISPDASDSNDLKAEEDYGTGIVSRIKSTPGANLPKEAAELKRDTAVFKAAIIIREIQTKFDSKYKKQTILDKVPPTHWLINSDGDISMVSREVENIQSLGELKGELTDSNTIVISVMTEYDDGSTIISEHQIESLARLILNIENRWGIPTKHVYSYGEVALPPGRVFGLFGFVRKAKKINDLVQARH